MAFGDLSLDAPEKPNKGHEGGACNRRSCQAEPAIWYNHGSHSWYCADCRADIEFDPVNSRDWEANHRPRVGHPMFETREQRNARRTGKTIDEQINDVVGPHFGWPSEREKLQSSSLSRLLKTARRRP